MSLFGRSTPTIPAPQQALPGREDPMAVAPENIVLHHPMTPPFPEGSEVAVFGMGCFWGIERLFWRMPGVWTTAAGYAGGSTPNPTYQEVCSGGTGHTEVVLVVHDPAVITYDQLLAAFWENHDPTQGMRQWNDVGTQYRSAIYTTTQAQFDAAVASMEVYQGALLSAGKGEITTEIRPLGSTAEFFYAEDYHQQYLEKNPGGYCDMHGTGVACSITGTRGTGVTAS
ncbi:peptide-methionine (S)-S-oxide reductase MsrA [Nakamurella sp. YIM 132087]|uniref:Peptide methionine sulfoxide reductase MsrA n=1 Tax=Nakamurella alba TaxID=2665158 RepID=A0A7K1FNB8_9ACTN|nr:peptide-methionine (S)-S-oxide reductase MsrA [Nakamurella alba]MTD15661.1 peptide-methionine (S)-S-oxide reductase MsrA [Nakamurella alba]